MDLRKLINNLLSENRKYEFGCVMLSFNFPQIKEIHNIIDDDDLYIDENDPSFGLEKDSHCTLLYGLHKDVTLNDVQTIAVNKNLEKLNFIIPLVLIMIIMMCLNLM